MMPDLIIALPPSGGAICPSALFDPPVSAVWLEIGFGGGEHLAEQARLHPEVGLIGCEVFVNGVASLLGHLDKDEPRAQVRIHPEDARPLLAALPEASIDRAFLLFPDPWPKARHAERRFVSPENLDQLARILTDGAQFRVASDDPNYVAWADHHLRAHPDFAEGLIRTDRAGLLSAGLAEDWPPTRFEIKCLAGRDPVFFIARRRPRG